MRLFPKKRSTYTHVVCGYYDEQKSAVCKQCSGELSGYEYYPSKHEWLCYECAGKIVDRYDFLKGWLTTNRYASSSGTVEEVLMLNVFIRNGNGEITTDNRVLEGVKIFEDANSPYYIRSRYPKIAGYVRPSAFVCELHVDKGWLPEMAHKHIILPTQL